ncbi:hypothetical protein [Anabaena subtropica]|uniref:Uncharacterized protein n=1 Tax=Anabaena subtropica FACHB-260 TaxID=2692884 RepID=A0ABR8CU28_9NOST|nr:hypothetical protein [Anabaena subtropica]MBD2346489.1 hypothetical protein [Anabaena subtropica FACHB-260]
MLAIAQNNLFTEVAIEESATVSGGQTTVNFDLNAYLFIVGAGTVFGAPGLTTDELQFAFESAISIGDNNNNG